MSLNLDKYDLHILNELQQRGRQSNLELSERVHLSASQCLRRVRRLEQKGVIRAFSALLDPETIGLSIQAFIYVTLEKHGKDPAATFAEQVHHWDEVLSCWAVTGDADYMMHVIAPDLKVFSELVLKRLLAQPLIASVKSNILLDVLKDTRVLPTHHLAN